jgi:hypothetical protein
MCWAYHILYVDISFNKNIKFFKKLPYTLFWKPHRIARGYKLVALIGEFF